MLLDLVTILSAILVWGEIAIQAHSVQSSAQHSTFTSICLESRAHWATKGDEKVWFTVLTRWTAKFEHGAILSLSGYFKIICLFQKLMCMSWVRRYPWYSTEGENFDWFEFRFCSSLQLLITCSMQMYRGKAGEIWPHVVDRGQTHIIIPFHFDPTPGIDASLLNALASSL